MPGQYVIARSANAGVFAGTLHAPVTELPAEGQPVTKLETVVLADAKRIHYWNGAASLSELAARGTSKPNDCRIPMAVPIVQLEGVCELLPVTDEARKSIESVPLWTR